MTHPRAPSSALETIQTKLANGALDEAGTLIDELLVEFASDPNLAYLSALRYRLSGNAAKALQTLSDLTAAVPDMARAHQEMAVNCLSLNLPQKALEAAEAAVALDGSCSPVGNYSRHFSNVSLPKNTTSRYNRSPFSSRYRKS